MSTVSPNASLLNQPDEYPHAGDNRLAPYFTTEPALKPNQSILPYKEFVEPSARARLEQRPHVLRRFQGFLVEVNGREARIAIVKDGQTILYDVPYEPLLKNHISVKNQPFQMDEIELKTDDGLIVGYRYKLLAKQSDAFIEPLEFDEDHKRKREIISHAFGKAQD